METHYTSADKLTIGSDHLQPELDLGMTLVAIREESGMDEEEFAHHLGISPKLLAELEQGTANPQIRLVAWIFKRMGLSLHLHYERKATWQ